MKSEKCKLKSGHEKVGNLIPPSNSINLGLLGLFRQNLHSYSYCGKQTVIHFIYIRLRGFKYH